MSGVQPSLDSVKRYRILAQDARNEADKTSGSMRESYLLIAAKCDKMADKLESDEH